MEPIKLDNDYFMLRIGRLVINNEAIMSQRDAAYARVEELEKETAELKARVADLEAVIEDISSDDE